MKRRERIFIYSALIALLAINAVFLLSSTGRQAFAEASAWLEGLGPAESLTLTDGEKQLVLRSASGRLAWGEGDIKQARTIAFVDVGKPLVPMLDSQRFVEEREAMGKELKTTEDDYRARLDALDQEIKTADRNDPATQTKMQDFMKLRQEYYSWVQQTVVPRRAELDAKHLQQAYREVVAAVNIVADRMGIDIVLRFIPTEQEFQTKDAGEEIRLRTALRYPEKLDITAEVMEELSLESASP